MSDTIDITFTNEGKLTLWLPFADDTSEYMQFDVSGPFVRPETAIDLFRLKGRCLTVRLLDDNGEEM